MVKTNRECCVCTKFDSPYKCPRCKSFYCCLECSKKHKNDCTVDTQNTMSPKIDSTKNILSASNAIIKYDLLSMDQVEKLNNSTYINTMISSKRLRSHILEVDGSSDKQETLKKLRQNSTEFELFIQNMLRDISSKS